MAGSEAGSGNVSLSGCNVLLVIGEPFGREHKELILEQITKGFQSWDVERNGDVNTVLEHIADAAPSGEEGEFGDVTIKHAEDGFAVTVLVNPPINSVRESFRDLLVTPSKHKHVVFGGHSFQGTGAWILQDDTFSVQNMVQIFRESDIDNSIKQQGGATFSLHCPADGDWKASTLAKHDFGKLLNISINPEPRLSSEASAGIQQFTSYLSFFVKAMSSHELMQSSDVVGSIKFSKPTMYIFPGSQGDSALFGVSGFSLLVNGGYQRKPCFWDFARHLDRIDALLVTHLNGDNMFGVRNALNRKLQDSVHPEIGHVFLNASEKVKHSPNGDLHPEAGGSLKDANLLVNLVGTGNALVENLASLGLPPQPCTRSVSNGQHPVNLYHKVGHGRLDMFVLNPVQDSKELKDFFQQWNKQVNSFTSQNQIPLPNVVSVSALMVWRPANPKEKITRILFPGAAPQSKIFEGLDKIKTLDCLKQAECCENDFHAKPITKKPASKTSKPKAAPTPQVVVVHDKPAAAAKSKPASRPEKATKDSANKKSTPKAQKDRFERSKTPSPPVRSPVATPVHARTPAPEEPAPPVPEEPAPPAEPAKPASPVEPAPPVEEPAPPVEEPLPPVEPLAPEPEPVAVEEPIAPAPEMHIEEAAPEADFVDDTPRMASDEVPTPPMTPSPEPPAEPSMEPPFVGDVEPESAPNVLDEPVADLLGAPLEPSAAGDSSEPLMEPTPVVKSEPEALHEPPTEDLLGGGVDAPELKTEQVPEPTEAWPAEATPVDEHSPEALPEPQEIDPSMLEPAPVVPDYEAEGFDKAYDEEKDVDTAAVEEDVPAEEPVAEGEEVEQEAPEDLNDSGVCQDTGDESLQELAAAPTKAQLEELGIYDDEEVEEPLPPAEEDGDNCLGEEPQADGEHLQDILTGAQRQVDVMTQSMYSEDGTFEAGGLVDPAANLEAGPADDAIPEVLSAEEDVPSAEVKVEALPEVPMDVDSSEEGDVSDMKVKEPEQESEQVVPEQPKDSEDLSQVTARDTPTVLSRPDSSDGYDDFSSLHVEPSQSEPELEKMDEDVAEAERHQQESGAEEEERDQEGQPDDAEEEIEPVAEVYDNEGFNVDDDDDVLPSPVPEVDDGDKLVEPAAVDLLSDAADEGDSTPVNEKELAPPDLLANFDQPAPVEKSTNPFEAEFDPFAPSAQVMEPELVSESQPAPAAEIPAEQPDAFGAQSFDPLQEWGQPTGLPAPPPPPGDDKGPAKKPTSKTTGTRKSTASAATSRSRLADKTKAEAPKKSPSPAKSTSSASSKSRPTTAPSKARASPVGSAKNGPAGDKKSDVGKTTRTRPATAAAGDRGKTSKDAEKKPAATRAPARSSLASRKPAAGSKSGSSAKLAPALTPVTPCYVDLSYVPYHANPKYSDIDFFRRVRARYYVVSSLYPSPTVLNNLLDAKQTWEDKDLEVTIIPTYDTDTFRHWMGLHHDKLAELKIDVAPSASRCTIQLQDHETSCSAYRLEF